MSSLDVAFASIEDVIKSNRDLKNKWQNRGEILALRKGLFQLDTKTNAYISAGNK